MNPDPLPPVPSPPEHYWRQFRINIVPSLAFVAVLGATIWLWGKNLANPLVMGQAESAVTDITSPKIGRIEKLNVTLFQEVKVGDVIAVVDVADPRVLSNTLAVVRAEMDQIRTEASLDTAGRVRLADFHLSWMTRRADLAAAKAQLIYAQAEYERTRALTAEKIVDPRELEIARRDYDQWTLQVEQMTQAVESADKSYRELDPAAATTESPITQAALKVAEQKLHLAEAELQPITLVATINGRVSKLEKLAGATVAAGDPIVTIANPTADRIIGYLSQPLRIEPKIGMRAEIRSRGLVRKVGEAQVTEIGPRIDLFDAPLRIRGMGAAQERGLPIIMSVPPNLNIRPGELVDIRLLVN